MNEKKSNKVLLFTTILLVLLLVSGVFADSNKGRSTNLLKRNYVELSDNEDNDDEKDSRTLELKRFYINSSEDKIENIQVLKIEPSRQVDSDGQAVYKITVKDLHTVSCTNTTANDTNNTVIQNCTSGSYNYVLTFEPLNSNLTGTLSKTNFTLEAGKYETVELTVKAENKGANYFTIKSKVVDSTASVKGALLFPLIKDNDSEEIGRDVSFFIGKGFAINEGETDGFLTDIKILNKDGVLSGKVTLDKSTFKIEGKVLSETNSTTNSSVRKIEFDVTPPKTGEIAGKFSGTVKKVGPFLLLKGTLDNFEDSDWNLTAMSSQKEKITQFSFDDESEKGKQKKSFKEFVKVKGFVLVEKSRFDDFGSEVYISPVKVEKAKIFKIIPNPWGNKVASIEITKGDKVIRKEIKQNHEEIFEHYKISVGDLENEEEVELEIEEA